MRILFIVHGYKPAYRMGGPIVSVSELAENLVKKGHSVIVFTTNSNHKEILDVPVNCPIIFNGVEVWYFEKKNVWPFPFSSIPYFSKSIGFFYCPKMAEELKKIITTVDVVHTHMPFVYPTYIASKISFANKKPLFYHQRGIFDPVRLNFRSFKKRLYIKLIERSILKKAAVLIALTKAEIESYKKVCPENNNIVEIPNGIDINKYLTIPSVEKVFELNDDIPVILFLGRLHPIKGADKLLNAFIEISQNFPEAVLIMAGPDEFNIENGLKEKVNNSIKDKIIFTGMVDGNEKKNILARADIFCLPSDAEGFSIAILEAMASETAVLISPGCHFEKVQERFAGRIVDANVYDLVKVLSELLLNMDIVKKMGKNGRELVSSKYSWDSISDKMINTYIEGIARNNLNTF
jgi:glycosyltransferase involved in cell wall biosynthesis